MQAFHSAATKLLCLAALAAVVSSSILDFRPSYRNNNNIARKRALKVLQILNRYNLEPHPLNQPIGQQLKNNPARLLVEMCTYLWFKRTIVFI